MKKIWRWLAELFSKPSTRIGLGVLVTVGFIAGILAWQGFNKAMDLTNTTEFCVSCHTMQGNQTELKPTVHGTNRSGVTPGCPDCHVPHDFSDKIARKMKASVEVWSHLTGKIGTADKFEAHRLRLAQNEWDRFKANGSKECRTCHDYSKMDFDKMRPASQEPMRGAAERDQSCMDCHKGIAHHMPDMKNSHNPAFDSLVQAADSTRIQDGNSYINALPRELYSDEALGKAAGRIEIATPLKVLKQVGDAQQIELLAWRKSKGYGRVWYSQFGMNIVVATLDKATAQDKSLVEVLESKEDPNTGLIWQKVRAVFWTKQGGVMESADPIWDVARNSYQTSCSVCHKQPDVAHFDSNTWPGLFSGMVGFTNMDKDTQALVLKYLQNHSSDFDKTAH
ncbi:pentaheme c-type cytochrome TorC [Craterilacuibacter sp. RT1T]|uniref:pentaheme c-type cytochrome TorC n=1 Tax=Craterilacuibacter sp. RT1T TaxID=2942211 RepID=UPI0020C04BC6|nr:pentaheme c-type cytochrome TorC [Craterilacuibacter sp. RT1T]MCL6263748.1 pentaheme c-type cytochrome TorC [Craterilacuibacter sp. RT1T]